MCDFASMVATDAVCRTLPATCSGRKRVSGKTAHAFSSGSRHFMVSHTVEVKQLRAGDHANEPPKIEPVAGEIIGQDLQRRRDRRLRFEVIDRLDERPAEQQRPDAIHRSPSEVAVFRVRDPRRQALSRRTVIRQQFRVERHLFRDNLLFLRFAVLNLVLATAVVDSFEAETASDRRTPIAPGNRPASSRRTGDCGTGRNRAAVRGMPA